MESLLESERAALPVQPSSPDERYCQNKNTFKLGPSRLIRVFVSNDILIQSIWYLDSYPGAEGPSGCVADFAAARAGLETATASSATGACPEPGLTVASLLACSVYKNQG